MTGLSPGTPRQLNWLLARRMSAAALGIGVIAGGVSYFVETRRVEQAAFQRAITAASHLASPAMQALLPNGKREDHEHLKRLLDRTRFVGIRVIDRDRKPVFETWENVPSAVVAAVSAHPHDWPAPGASLRNWVHAADERLIQVVLPLTGVDSNLVGYLEGIYRLDQESISHQRQQIQSATMSAVVSVFATAGLLYPLLLAMLRRSASLSERLLDANLSLIGALGNAVAKRDSDTDAHNYRVTLYAVALAEAIGVSNSDMPALVAGAFLHDVGKIGIPDRILQKPGSLTPEETEVMKTHALLGLDIVAGNAWLTGAATVIRHHHERFDGTGYPDGLQGTAIPRNARIFAVVDVFDALTSIRPYKAMIPLAEALSILDEGAGRHFDPEAVAVFKTIAPALYGRIAKTPTAQLRTELRSVLARYFKTDAAPEGAAV